MIFWCTLDKELIYSTVSKYADDTKNKAKVSNQKDTENFQRELDEVIYPWAPANNMSLNGDKFDYHRIGIKPGFEKACYRNPTGDPIIEKDHIKELGVYISSDLSWSKQIEEVVSKTRSMSGWTLLELENGNQ